MLTFEVWVVQQGESRLTQKEDWEIRKVKNNQILTNNSIQGL